MDITRLKDIREYNELKQREMVDVFHVSRSTYASWEVGLIVIPLDKLIEYANYFHVRIDYVLSLTDERNEYVHEVELSLKDLGARLKKVRLRNHLSQENVAIVMKSKQDIVSKYERGACMIPTIKLYRFAKEFHVSIDYLCGRIDVVEEKVGS